MGNICIFILGSVVLLHADCPYYFNWEFGAIKVLSAKLGWKTKFDVLVND